MRNLYFVMCNYEFPEVDNNCFSFVALCSISVVRMSKAVSTTHSLIKETSFSGDFVSPFMKRFSLCSRKNCCNFESSIFVRRFSCCDFKLHQFFSCCKFKLLILRYSFVDVSKFWIYARNHQFHLLLCQCWKLMVWKWPCWLNCSYRQMHAYML